MSALSQRPCRLGIMVVAVALLAGVTLWSSAAAQVQPSPPVISSIDPPPFGDFQKIGGFQFDTKYPANTPVKDLMPVTPKSLPDVLAVPGDDLMQVPEVSFQQHLEAPKKPGVHFMQTMQEMGQTTAKIRHVNQKSVDGYLKALLQNRQDLAGLSFLMGEDCKMKKEAVNDFKLGLDVLRISLKQTVPAGAQALVQLDATTAALFWNTYQDQWTNIVKKTLVKHPFHHEHINAAHLAGLTQVLMPESSPMRQGLAKYLGSVPTVEATRALAKMAIYSPEKEVRQEALKVLKVRREKDYTDILVAGLKYPWPVVAQRAGEALVQLECNSVVPQLVDMIDDADPRAPVAKNDAFVARQMVKLNHHHNCLMCHSPVDKTTPPQAVTAPMPIPGVALGSFQEGYNSIPSTPDILVRIDVTYLRQDFSVLQPVADAHPWPRMQRFDFLVRDVTLTPAQAKALQQKLQPAKGAGSPYQQVVLGSLRSLTGLDAAATPQAWKQALKLPS